MDVTIHGVPVSEFTKLQNSMTKHKVNDAGKYQYLSGRIVIHGKDGVVELVLFSEYFRKEI